jgi:hypothetical protein
MVIFLKLFAATDNEKRLTVDDFQCGLLLFQFSVRIFNIISLHFGERGGTKIATLRCNVGLLASGPGRSGNGLPTSRCLLLHDPALVAMVGRQRSPIATDVTSVT